jgi:hypothetical protein
LALFLLFGDGKLEPATLESCMVSLPNTLFAFVLLAQASFAILQQPMPSAGTATSDSQKLSRIGDWPLAKLQKSAEAGDPAAQNELGVRYQVGIDVEKNPEESLAWFRKAAKAGYGKAMFNLGASYYNGDGIVGNKIAAMRWFVLAEQAGDSSGKEGATNLEAELSPKEVNEAYIQIGEAYEQGTEVKQDYARAMDSYRREADRKDGAACHKIASLYANGRGVPKDNAEILRWLQQGADWGDANSAVDLGRAYAEGTFVPQDWDHARKLFAQAAAVARHPAALFYLGEIYEKGSGVTADATKALMYYLLAAHYGSEPAKQSVVKLSSQLGKKQTAKANSTAQTWMDSNKNVAITLSK